MRLRRVHVAGAAAVVGVGAAAAWKLRGSSVVRRLEPRPGERLLGLYQGIPLTERTSSYTGVLPDKITIFRGPLERISGGDERRLRAEIRHVVIHEVAHHFGISDERLLELGRY